MSSWVRSAFFRFFKSSSLAVADFPSAELLAIAWMSTNANFAPSGNGRGGASGAGAGAGWVAVGGAAGVCEAGAVPAGGLGVVVCEYPGAAASAVTAPATNIICNTFANFIEQSSWL